MDKESRQNIRGFAITFFSLVIAAYICMLFSFVFGASSGDDISTAVITLIVLLVLPIHVPVILWWLKTNRLKKYIKGAIIGSLGFYVIIIFFLLFFIAG